MISTTRFLTLLAAAALIAVALPSLSTAQVKIATVDVQKIRDGAPRFKQALAEIDDMVADFEAQRDQKRTGMDGLAQSMQEATDRNQASTVERLRREMTAQSQDYQAFMDETFGTDGIIESKSSELLAPLYDDLAEAAKTVAKTQGLDLILDLEQVNPLYSNNALDVTQSVLDEFLKFR